MDSYKPRTYGKRGGTKRKQETCSPIHEQPITPTSSPTKRRRVSPPLVAATASPSPNPVELVNSDEDGERPAPSKSTTKSGINARKAAAKATNPSSLQDNVVKTKLTPDLSGIFDAVLSPASTPASPTKLAKRMLARSKTESSVGSPSASQENTNGLERTASLPSLPPSPSKVLNRSSSSSGSLLPMLPPVTKTTTRTYAGKFRSFLVPQPSSNSQIQDDEGEFETRESYSSLRSRWDVDNSEDDPYPTAPSPSKSKSNSATPDMSPSRSGKRKSKAASSAARLVPIPYGVSNPLKSISELRNKGESRRFLDELGYLFEGMEGQGGLGLRRASALEITTKLCDDDFARKAKAADFYTRTWDLFVEAGAGKGEDKILDILLVFFVALVARDPVSLVELTQRPVSPPPSPSVPSKQKSMPKKEQGTTFFTALFRVLDLNPPNVDPLVLMASHSASDVDLKSVGVNKKDKTLLSTIYNTISTKSDLFPEDTIASTSLLIAFSLQSLPPHSIPINYFPGFLASLRYSLSSGAPTSLSASLSSRWLNAANTLPYSSVYYHLRLLDIYLLDLWDTPHDDLSQDSLPDDKYLQLNDNAMNKAREEWLADDLGALGVCIELASKGQDPETFPARKYLETTLRVLVTLTHTDELWARKVTQGDYTVGWLLRTLAAAGRDMQSSQASIVKKEEDDDERASDGADASGSGRESDAQALDTLCLALGLLTNMVQSVDETKYIIRETHLDPACVLRKPACGRKCACTRRVNGIQILATLYSQQQAKLDAVPAASTTDAAATADTPEALAEADASFLRGHLAVLFGLLMAGSAENETAVLAALPSPFAVALTADAKKVKAARRAKLARLAEQARDFAVFYTAVSGNIGGDVESKVAGDVVRFLEAKRDAVI